MDIKQLELFLHVCRSGSLSKAAEKLYITQQGLSRSVRSLEKKLGVTLFQRTRNGIMLTPAGEVFQQYAVRVLDEYNALNAQLGGAEPLTGTNRLSVVYAEGVMLRLSTDWIDAFRREHPDVELVLEECSTTEETTRLVKEGKYDVGLGFRGVDTSIFDFKIVFPGLLSFLVHVDNPLSDHRCITIREACAQKLMLPGSENPMRTLFMNMAEEAGATPIVDCVTSDIHICMQYAAQNLGLAACTSVFEYEEMPDCVRNIPVCEGLRCDVLIFTKRETESFPARRSFLEHTAMYGYELQQRLLKERNQTAYFATYV